MAIGQLQLPSWLQAGEPPSVSLERGVRAGTMMASSFTAARRQRLAEQEYAEQEPMRLLQQTLLRQETQANTYKLADTLKKRQDELHAEGALTVFADRIRRAQLIGPSEPIAQAGVIDWVQNNRGLLTLPAGKALWEDYMQGIDEDRKHKAQIETLKLGIDERAATAGIAATVRNQQAFDIEQFRQQNRTQLEKQREQFRRELATDPLASRVTEDQYINRHLNSFVGPVPIMGETLEQRGQKFALAEKSLREMYREAHATNAAPRAVAAPVVAPAPAARPRLSRDQAIDFLKQAGGDKDKARKMARDAGYEF